MNIKTIANTTLWTIVAMFNIVLLLAIILAVVGYDKPLSSFLEIMIAGR